MFLFKNKKIHVDCFTPHQVIAKDNPIQKASNFMPDWWKKLEKFNTAKTQYGVEIQTPTMRTCIGLLDLYSKGFIIPMWSDLNLRIADGSFAYQFATNIGTIISHDKNQYGNNFKDLVQFKLTPPWAIKEKTGVEFLFTGCSWSILNEMPKLTMVTGVVNYRVTHSCNINGFAFSEKDPYQYNFSAGTPMVQVIPLSEKEVVTHVHAVDENEWRRINDSLMRYKFRNWGFVKKKSNSSRI